jgi:hypothetical protein
MEEEFPETTATYPQQMGTVNNKNNSRSCHHHRQKTVPRRFCQCASGFHYYCFPNSKVVCPASSLQPGVQVLVLMSSGEGVVQSYNKALGSLFVAPYAALAGLWWTYSNPLHTGNSILQTVFNSERIRKVCIMFTSMLWTYRRMREPTEGLKTLN